MPPGGLQQALFAKFLSLAVHRLRDSIGVKQDRVTWSQYAFFHRAIPFLEQAHHRAGGAEPFHLLMAPQEQRSRMPAIRVAQLARFVVIFSKEQRRVIPIARVFVKQTIHRLQKSFGLFPSGCALAAQSCLEIGHEQSGSDPLAGYVRYHEAEPSAAEIEKVVIVSTDRPGGMANSRIDKRSSPRLVLRKQTGLHLLGDGQVVSRLALRFQLGGLCAALGFQSACCLVELNQRKTVSVYIFKNRVPRLPASPGRFHWWEREADSASRPFSIQTTHVFGKKAKSGVLADPLAFCRSFGGNHESHPGQAPTGRTGEPACRRRRNKNPPFSLGCLQVHDHLEI